MVQIYVALCDFWHKNVLVPKDARIGLKDGEVKYLGHVVERYQPAPEVSPVAETVADEPEAPVPAPAKRKRGEDA